MKNPLPSLPICLALLAGPAAHAQDLPAAARLLGAREHLVATLDAMPEVTLRGYFLRCSSEAERRPLSLDDAVPCAVAWDTLLRREYRGDIEALLAWWREHRDALFPR